MALKAVLIPSDSPYLEHNHSPLLCPEVADTFDCADRQDKQEPGSWPQAVADGVMHPNSSTTPTWPHGEWRGGVCFPALDLGLGLRS